MKVVIGGYERDKAKGIGEYYSIEPRKNLCGYWVVDVYKNNVDGTEWLGHDYGLSSRDFAISAGKRILDNVEA